MAAAARDGVTIGPSYIYIYCPGNECSKLTLIVIVFFVLVAIYSFIHSSCSCILHAICLCTFHLPSHVFITQTLPLPRPWLTLLTTLTYRKRIHGTLLLHSDYLYPSCFSPFKTLLAFTPFETLLALICPTCIFTLPYLLPLTFSHSIYLNFLSSLCSAGYFNTLLRILSTRCMMQVDFLLQSQIYINKHCPYDIDN